MPENRGNRGGAGAGRKETALSPGSARRGARRTSGARNSSYGVGRSRDPVGGRGIGSAVAAVQHPLCSSRCQAVALVPVVRQALRAFDNFAIEATRLPNGFVG